jgi:hypothetical protein
VLLWIANLDYAAGAVAPPPPPPVNYNSEPGGHDKKLDLIKKDDEEVFMILRGFLICIN